MARGSRAEHPFRLGAEWRRLVLGARILKLSSSSAFFSRNLFMGARVCFVVLVALVLFPAGSVDDLRTDKGRATPVGIAEATGELSER